MWVSYPRVLISCSAAWPEVHLQGKKLQISLAIILCLPAHPSFFLRASAVFRHSLRTSARQEEEWPGPVGHRNTAKSVLKTLSLAEYKILVVVFSNPVFLSTQTVTWCSVTAAHEFLSIYLTVCPLPWQYIRLSSSSPHVPLERSQSQ